MKNKKTPDPDKPLTDSEFKAMRTVYGIDGLAEIMGEEFVSPLRSRGRPKASEPKQKITIRLNSKAVSALRESGKGWQTRLDDFINKAVEQGLV